MSDPRQERAAVVALLRAGSTPWPQVAADVLEAGSALAVLREPTGQAALFDDSVERLDAALAEIEAWEDAGIGVHTILDGSYPPFLRDIRESPPILFSRGTMASDPRAIAVVGSRSASEFGLRLASAIGTELVHREITVVSGLAAGIDTAVHEAALAAGGRTVAVIGTGIQQFYPRDNRALQRRIGELGLVLSQFWPEAPPARHQFPMRNAVMSGYCAATVVVEAGEHSGARIQARLALQHGRQVILRDDLLGLQWAKELADRPGVHVVADLDRLITVIDVVLRQREALLSPDGGLADVLG